ncbi:MAG: CoA-binding protein [Deltaproteobacteria bacterium]|nr:CoA-binding protein [Deltaproteobacteria bacterium]MBW2052695.1 CoA-binding protein [Deltaproteobacteria bacterium]MBW2141976.1 CoA-binding protein [Deltaproteobacteria bacterium]MBW2324581.1 CoA-binding protein [Deltaproteobacteria bacterium]
MDSRMKESLEAIFKPRSVAIVGASNNPRRWGNETMRNMLTGRYRHKLYPINPSEDEVLGVKCYPSLSNVPGKIDLAIIVINASLVPEVIQECIDKKVKGGVVITAGFAELGSEGAKFQRKLAQESKQAGFNFIGPNCLGIWSSEGNVNTVYWDEILPLKGPVSFISQSGTLGEYFAKTAKKFGFGISKFVSCGNQACVNFIDLLEYFGDDPETKVIAGYVEDVGDGRRFLEVASAVTAKKPILIYKAGSTEAAARAARSHTAAIAGNLEFFDAACRQAGVIRWQNFLEMFYMAEALGYQPLPRGNRVAVMSSGGGFCVTAAEACTQLGLELPEMTAEVQTLLREQMQSFAPPPVNPIDCIARKGRDAYIKIIEIVASQDYIDGLIATPGLGRFDRASSAKNMIKHLNYAETIAAVPKKFNKPIILGDENRFSGPAYEIFKRNHIPFFDNPMDCAKAMYGLMKYGEIRNR